MNISYSWLKDYIKTDVGAEEIAKILTSIGLEVGTVEKIQTIKGGLEGLVVGEVLTCRPHENSDHMHVTTVNVGKGDPLQIVCGAPNVAAGQKVIVATIGTVLYEGDKSFTIKKSKLRGIDSNGMICAEDEIGVGSDHAGIMVLPNDTQVGLPAKEYFNVKDDYVIEVDITPNRADAISHYGVARDLNAYFLAHKEPTKLTIPDVDNFKVENHDLEIAIEVPDHTLCPRYAGVTINNIIIKESPEWLQNKLRLIGLNPINNVVDVTNYVLHAFGQPLHSFDAAKIKGNKVIVKTVAEGTKFTTLDGVERALSAEDLMICNAEEPMCMGGVFGGIDSGISESSTSVFLESAYFNPVTIRKTARRHGLNTDASFRFERGIDPNNTIYCLKYAAMLIKELGGGQISSNITDIYPEKIKDFVVDVTFEKIDSLIGKHIGQETLETIFKGLEMNILKKTDKGYELQVPAYRVDVQRDVDVIEDILRIYGYNNVEFSDSLKSNLSYTTKPDSLKLQNLISEQLTANGFYEVLNNSLTKGSYYDDLRAFPADNCIKLMNPLSLDLNVMRQTLLFGGLENILRNVNRQTGDLKFYEFGNCYRFDVTKKTEEDHLKGYSESYHTALWITGNKTEQNWSTPISATTYYQLKAYVENILTRLGVNIQNINLKETNNELFSQSLEYYTRTGMLLCSVSIVSPKLLKKMDIGQPVYYADLEWNNLMKETAKHMVYFTEISKFPAVRRDLALLLDKQTSFAEIEKIAHDTERKLLKNVTLFDVYEGKNLPVGKKSYAVSFTLQDEERTLNDKQIDNIMQRLTKNLVEKLHAEQR